MTLLGDYYTYKNESFTCKKCGWGGTGNDAAYGDSFEYGFEINCPSCDERLNGLISFPTLNDMLESGSEQDVLHAKDIQAFRQKWEVTALKDASQLPELHHSFMAFILSEEEEGDERYIKITYRGEIIWRELQTWEYYDRFMELGNILKQKYGDNMIDLVPDVEGLYLYGDSISASQKIKAFRKSLRNG